VLGGQPDKNVPLARFAVNEPKAHNFCHAGCLGWPLSTQEPLFQTLTQNAAKRAEGTHLCHAGCLGWPLSTQKPLYSVYSRLKRSGALASTVEVQHKPASA